MNPNPVSSISTFHKIDNGLQNVILSPLRLNTFPFSRSNWQSLEGYAENLCITYRNRILHSEASPFHSIINLVSANHLYSADLQVLYTFTH